MDEMTVQNHAVVRRATDADLAAITHINAKVFLGDRDNFESATEWIGCWFNAFPLYQYFVIEVDGVVAGYVGWQIHGGFLRPEPVIELEQLGVDPKFQGQKLGPKLTEESMREVVAWIQKRNNRIESHVSVIVWGYASNFNAMKVYYERFTEGARGFRIQFGDRAETMLRTSVPLIRPIRENQ